MSHLQAFFRRAARDGLKSAHLVYRGRKAYFDAAARRDSPSVLRGPLFLGLLALALLAAVAGWRSGWLEGKTDLPRMQSGEEILRIILEDRSGDRLRLYLQGRRYLDFPDEYGWTALHWAAFLGDGRMMDLLRGSGAAADAATTKDWFIFPRGSRPGDIARLGARMRAAAKQHKSK